LKAALTTAWAGTVAFTALAAGNTSAHRVVAAIQSTIPHLFTPVTPLGRPPENRTFAHGM
jgi:hypothetical protein